MPSTVPTAKPSVSMKLRVPVVLRAATLSTLFAWKSEMPAPASMARFGTLKRAFCVTVPLVSRCSVPMASGLMIWAMVIAPPSNFPTRSVAAVIRSSSASDSSTAPAATSVVEPRLISLPALAACTETCPSAAESAPRRSMRSAV